MDTDELTLDEATSSDVLAPGSKLLSGQYEILRYLSSGGFGITYLAKDSLNRTVVIKECFPEAFCSRVNKTVRARSKNHTDDFRSIVELFIKEAHALSRMQHPSVVGVHLVFEDNETAYMALDLIDGQDLLDVIECGETSISPQTLHEITLKLLDAVSHIHGQDLLHRDISPDNILLDKKGHPVLIDFGAAREEASRKTRVLSSVLVVKDGYSPPEFYVSGSAQLPCSDLYALAATLSHLISNEAPPNSQVRLAAMASNEPDPYIPLAGRFAQYDHAFLAAIDEAMHIVPAKRLQSAEEWMLQIDPAKRLAIARSKAQSDASIDQTVIQLVRSAHEEAVLSEARHDKVEAPHGNEDAPAQKETAEASAAAADTKPICAVSSDEDALFEQDIQVHQSPCAEDKTQGLQRALTPIERVRSKEVTRSIHKSDAKEKPCTTTDSAPQKLTRLASIPIVFCAYFFYGSAALQYDAVQAATIQPLAALSVEMTEGLLNFGQYDSKRVVVRRGFED